MDSRRLGDEEQVYQCYATSLPLDASHTDAQADCVANGPESVLVGYNQRLAVPLIGAHVWVSSTGYG